MSALTVAFTDLQNAFADANGGRLYATFQGNQVEVVPGLSPVDLQPVQGGSAQVAPVMLSVALSAVTQPVQSTANPLPLLTFRGFTYAVHKSTVAEGRIDLLCADPSAEFV